MNDVRNTTTIHIAFVGWHDPPDGRGTYDILKSCIGTITLLCWSSVCPNVPTSSSRRFAIAREKLRLFILALIAPEFVLAVAAGQLHAAWNDRSTFKERGYGGWGLRRCFFVNMGGLCIHFTGDAAGDGEQQRRRQFPVNCKQLLYLVDKGYFVLPEISKEDIDTRNKSDGLSRSIAIVQVMWFTISTLARVVQGLHITSLELTTLSFVLVMVACTAAWWRKPMDISYPIVLQCEVSLSIILNAAEDPRDPRSRNYGSTPLNFLDRQEWFLSQVWSSYLNILRVICRRLRLFPKANNAATKPFPNSFPSVEFPQMTFRSEVFPGLLVLAYSSVFMSAWNGYFPTTTERTLWRVSSVICMGYGVLGGVVAILDRHGGSMAQWCRDRWRIVRKRDKKEIEVEMASIVHEAPASKSTQNFKWLQCICRRPNWLRQLSNLSPDDPDLDMALRIWVLATLLTIVYCFSRIFILVEDIIGLRRQPLSTYEAINWGRYSPLL